MEASGRGPSRILNNSSRSLSTETYSRPLTEMVLLGCLATRFPRTTLAWDAEALKVTNNEGANRFVRSTYREGYETEGL